MEITRERMAGMAVGLAEAIGNVTMKGRLNHDGSVSGTAKTHGYVCAIHGDDDGNEELRGTVDVQEFDYDAEDYNGQAAGFHEGVRLSAVSGNAEGFRIVPCMFSEVVITKDPVTLEEYVMFFSHASVVSLKAHDKVESVVREYEPFNATDDGLEKDYDELSEAGNRSSVEQTFQHINSEVASKDSSFTDDTTAEKRVIKVGGTTITIDGKKVEVVTSDSVTVKTKTALVEADDATIKAKSATITGGKLTTKGVSNTDLSGPFNAVKVCPFTGAPHCGSVVIGT